MSERGVTWRGYWPVALLAVTFLAVVLLFGAYLNGRQHTAELRAEKQRKAICAILANIPGHIPAEIVNARGVFARPGHPEDCQPIVHPATKRAATPTPAPTATVIIVNPGARATATVTAQPTPTPRSAPRSTPHSTREPTPAPSPSRTCVLTICTGGFDAGRPVGAAAAHLRLLLGLPRPDKRRPSL